MRYSHQGKSVLVYTQGKCYSLMRIIARKTLRTFWEKFPDSEEQLKAWYTEAKHATWQTPQDIKNQHGSASFPGNNRVVFNICGNKYRLIVLVKYEFEIAYIRFIGTHAEYDRIKAEEI